MIILGWIALLLAGFAVAIYASAHTIRHVEALAHGTRIPPFFIGITLLAIGTDLPEIANSLISCFAGHGDLNAGDSVGSAVTQATLVLGLLPILTGPLIVDRARILSISGACIVGLALGAWVMADGLFSSFDGMLMITAWLVGSGLVFWYLSPTEPVQPVPASHPARHALGALLFLALVGIGAAAAVAAFVQLSELLGVPEYVLSFLVSSIGTSLPELVVDVSALRAGLKDMALGDVLGSSFVDSTLSIGIGPMLFPSAVTAQLALTGSAVAITGIALMALVLAFRRSHTWVTGSALILIYIGIYFVLLR